MILKVGECKIFRSDNRPAKKIKKISKKINFDINGNILWQKLFNDIFYETEKYSFLIKEFSSKDYDYDYLVKIYRIDFEEFDRIKTEN